MVNKLWIAKSTRGYQAATYQLVDGMEWVPKYKADALIVALDFYSGGFGYEQEMDNGEIAATAIKEYNLDITMKNNQDKSHG